MRILITGATGFVGRAVTAKLLERGCEVFALSRDPEAARARLPGPVKILSWPAGGPGPQNPIANLPENLDAVIHLAGASIAGGLWTKSRKQKLWSSRVEGTRNLVAALASKPGKFPGAFVCASGLGYHGDAGERAVRPGDPPGNDFLGRLATAWESAAQAARAHGARVTIVRLGMVLGREGGALPPQALAFKLGAGAVLGSGKQYWPWIHVEDAAETFVRAARDPEVSGPVHAAAGEPVTQREFARTLGRALRRPVWFRVPAWALRAFAGEMADLFLHGQKIEPSADAGLRWNSLSAALADLFPRSSH
jgi:uncharacterized protein (TIGR01777 family)